MEKPSEAGKAADARPEADRLAHGGPGESLPVQALARVAPQSVQLAKDHALLAHSLWCGLVFALALVLTILNCLPPVEVGYRVTSQVLVSPQRLDAFKRELAREHSPLSPARDAGQERQSTGEPAEPQVANGGAPSSADLAPRLLSVTVLDDHTHNANDLGGWSADSDGGVLLEVVSLWPGRTTSVRVQQWMNQLTKPDARTLQKIDSARAERFARWEAQVQETYLNEYRSKRHAGTEDDDSGKMQLASTSERVPMQFASLGQSSSVTQKRTNSSGDEFEQQLVHALEDARQREKNAAAEVAAHATKLSGTLSLAGRPRVHATAHRMPSSLLLAMFVLGLAGAAIGGWANHRAQSGGTYLVSEVAESMQLLGLPVLGTVALPSHEIAGMPELFRQRLTSWRRRLVAQLLAVSEMVVLFWCLAIAIRMVLDPLWRGMLWENPLAGLSRLFVGLP